MKYNIDDKYMYEILDDYRSCNSQELRGEIYNTFCNAIWNNSNKRSTYKKSIKFTVQNRLLDTEIGKIFDTWSDIEYTSCRMMTQNKDYASLIRQKVNNIYTTMFDPTVCTKKKYLDLLKTPKRLYYEWINGAVSDPLTITQQIENAIEESLIIKGEYSRRKMNLLWEDYQKVINGFFDSLFNNYIPLELFENKSNLNLDIDTWNEDNYCIVYFCRSLSGYIKNYQKSFYGLKRGENIKYSYCQCGQLFEKKNNKHRQCQACKREKRRQVNKNYYDKTHKKVQ